MKPMVVNLSQNTTVHPLHTRLPAISPNTARLTRLATDARLALRLRCANVRALQISTSPVHWQSKGSVRIAHPTGCAHVSFDLAHWPALQMVAIDSDDSDGVPPAGSTATDEVPPVLHELHQAITEALLTPVTERLRTFGLDGIHFGAVSAAITSNEPNQTPTTDTDTARAHKAHKTAHRGDITVRFDMDDPSTAITLTIDRIDMTLLSHLEALVSVERIALSAQLLRVRVPGRALLGTQRVKISTLRSLRPGDILLNGLAPHCRTLLDACPQLDGLELVWGALGTHGLFSTGALEGHTIVIKDPPVMTETTEPTHSPANDLEETVDLAQLEIPIRLEIDTVALPLAQLSSLRAGYVIELPMPVAEAPVRLTAHGQTIGFGELVAVGDHLGIRIQQMANIDDSTD